MSLKYVNGDPKKEPLKLHVKLIGHDHLPRHNSNDNPVVMYNCDFGKTEREGVLKNFTVISTALTVQQLIDQLQKAKNKTMPVQCWSGRINCGNAWQVKQGKESVVITLFNQEDIDL